MSGNALYEKGRQQYPLFRYNGYSLSENAGEILIRFDFSIDGLCSFHPETRIRTENFQIRNDFDSPVAQEIVFLLGMTEAVSYLKAVCCPVMQVTCGGLTEEEILWWKKLYFRGLSEFFYRNGIETDFDTFLRIDAPTRMPIPEFDYNGMGKNLIPVGGGKDSAVTAELCAEFRKKNLFFTVNPQKARTDTVLAAGYPESRILNANRTIAPELLDLNKRGFLNGHTPFSAIVAFESLYCAYLTGSENIILSNESSANESNISGLEVNHQYSKSFEFEQDFNAYIQENIRLPIRYFSILRPFNELQIAKKFASLKQYHHVFRSCNAGSKTNVWCAKCAKCLFVYSLLSAFLDEEELVRIFGRNMLADPGMKADFDGLCGFTPVKPFECVGTAQEVRAALNLAVRKYEGSGRIMPELLRYFSEKNGCEPERFLFSEFNGENLIPEIFMNAVKEMFAFVADD